MTTSGGQEPRDDGDAIQAVAPKKEKKNKGASPTPATGGQPPRDDGDA